MKIKFLSWIGCPKCKNSNWSFEGDFDEKQITNGSIICKKGHKWNVSEEILRFDKEHSDEPMQFLNHPLTGFPKEVTEDERGEFLDSLSKFIQKFSKKSDMVIYIEGNPILYFNYMQTTSRYLIVANKDEGLLRQIQEMASKKLMYQNLICIKADKVDIANPHLEKLSIFKYTTKNKPKSYNVLSFEKDTKENVIWSGKDINLVFG